MKVGAIPRNAIRNGRGPHPIRILYPAPLPPILPEKYLARDQYNQKANYVDLPRPKEAESSFESEMSISGMCFSTN